MEKKLSVIIPAYNCEKYIEQCVNSVARQTYKNIEIIVIDDGSTDSTSAILDRMANNDNRIIVYHRSNHGVQESRNYGLENATGEYIAFLDGDDAVEKRMYEVLIRELENNNTDISACLYQKDFLTIALDNVDDRDIEKAKHLVLNGKNRIMDNLFEKTMCIQGFMWNKVYSKKSVDGCFFDKSISIVDDLRFSFDVITKNVRSASFVNLPFYRYRILQASSSHKTNLPRYLNALQNVEDMVKICLDTYNVSKNNALSFYATWIIYVASQISIQNLDQEERIRERDELLKKIAFLKSKKPKIGFKNSMKINLFVNHWRLYTWLLHKKERKK